MNRVVEDTAGGGYLRFDLVAWISQWTQ